MTYTAPVPLFPPMTKLSPEAAGDHPANYLPLRTTTRPIWNSSPKPFWVPARPRLPPMAHHRPPSPCGDPEATDHLPSRPTMNIPTRRKVVRRIMYGGRCKSWRLTTARAQGPRHGPRGYHSHYRCPGGGGLGAGDYQDCHLSGWATSQEARMASRDGAACPT